MEIDEIVLKNSAEMEKYFSPYACKTEEAYRFKKEYESFNLYGTEGVGSKRRRV